MSGAPDISPPRRQRAGRDLVAAAFPDVDPAAQGVTPDLIEGLHRSPRYLDLLAELPEDHPLRASTRFRVYHYPPGGNPKRIQGAWDHDVPNEDRLCALIAEGGIPPGRYVVVPIQGRRQAPKVEMHLDVVRSSAGGDGSLAERLLMQMMPNPHAPQQVDDQLMQALRDMAERLERIEAENENRRERVEQLEDALAQATAQEAEVIDDGPEGAMGRIVGEGMVRVIEHLRNGKAPKQAETVAPESNGRHTPLRNAGD